MKTKIKAILLSLSLLLGGLTVLIPAAVSAAADTCTWTGAVNANWSNGGNWNGCDNGNVPENGDSLQFNGGTATSTNDISGLSISTLSISAAQTISGNAFTIVGGFSNSAAGAVIDADITLGGTQAFSSTAGGSIQINSNLNLGAFNLTLFVNGGSMSIPGNISGSGFINKTGTNQLNLSGNNTFTGLFHIITGYVNAQSNNAFGSTAGGTTVDNGTTINVVTGGLVIPENFDISGSGNVGGGAIRNFTGANTLTGDITLSNSSVFLSSDSGSFLTVNGTIAGAQPLEIGGMIIFNGPTFFAGPMNILGGGELYFNAANVADVSNNGSLIGGTGSFGNYVTGGGDVLDPGASNAAGVLGAANTILDATSTFNSDLRSGSNDTLDVTGTIDLAGATLTTDLDYNAPNGTQFIIVANDGADAVTNTFAGLAEGAIFAAGGSFASTLQITYVGGTGNDIVLTVIKVAPTLTLGSSATTAAAGSSVTFTASLGVLAPAATGTVSFYDGATLLGTSAVNGSGDATLTTTALTAGSHSITAQYSGDVTYASSTSAVLGESITAAAGGAAPTLADTGASALVVVLFGLVLAAGGILMQTNLFTVKHRR